MGFKVDFGMTIWFFSLRKIAYYNKIEYPYIYDLF